MKACDVMKRDPVTATPDMTLEEALKLMVDQRLSGLPVVDGGGSLVGILTEGDLLRRAEIGTERTPSWLSSLFAPGHAASDYVRAHGRVIGDLMTWPVFSVAVDAPLPEVVEIMEYRDIKRVPVVEHGRPLGIVSRADLLRAVLQVISRTPNVSLSDPEIERRVRGEIAKLEWVPRFDVDVSVQDGVVELMGVIPDERERVGLCVLAANAAGARGVRDNLTCVEPMSGVVMNLTPLAH